MKTAYKLTAVVFALFAMLVIFKPQQAQAFHFNWAPGVSCPSSSSAPLQTGYISGFEIAGTRYYGGINLSVVHGTPSVSTTYVGEATICQFAPYSTVTNASIRTFNESSPRISVGDMWFGTMGKWPGYVGHGAIGVSINTSGLGVGWHTFCFDAQGGGNYPHLGNPYITAPASTICINVQVTAPPPTYWNYDINNESPTATGTYYPDTTLTFRSRVTNVGNGSGRSYTHSIIPLSADKPYLNPGTDLISSGNGGLAPGSSRVRSRDHVIRRTAPHNASLCFYSRVAPAGGQSTPSSTVTDSSDTTSNRCYTVYNRRFGIAKPTVVPSSPADEYALPGETVSYTSQACNSNSTLARAFGFTGATHYSTPSSVGVPVLTLNPSGLAGSPQSTNMANISTSGCANVSATFTVPTTASPGDVFCPTAIVSPTYGYSTGVSTGGTDNASSSVCTTVVASPYVKVYGNDIWAGGYFGDPLETDQVFNPANYPDCSVVSTTPLGIEAQDAVLKSHTKAVAGSVVGASVGYGGFATGEIYGMGSFDARTIYGRTGFALTFSNADVNQNDYTGSSARNRGHFPTEPRCINNYYDVLEKDSLPTPPASGVIPGGQYFHDGPFVIGGYTVGSPTTIIVNGDVTITDDIRMSIGPWGTTDNIPIFVLVVRGNLHINSTVEQLDGIYIAQSDPNDSAVIDKGVINTCGDSVVNLSVGYCNVKLNIFGAFVAQRVNFTRTFGSLGTLNSGDLATQAANSAEQFNFSPEFYLGDPYFIFENPPQTTTTLPGTYQVKDLPPIL